jgi:5-methylcytosine-specific restriction endonuclease McrA
MFDLTVRSVPKPGPTKKRKGGNKEKARKGVKKRDGDWCLLCGKPSPGLHLHRIVYGSQGGAYEKDNCVLLCVNHHGTVHGNKRFWMPKLLEYIEGTYER